MAGRAQVEAVAHWSGVAALYVNCDVSGADESVYTAWTYVGYAECYGVDMAYAPVWFEDVNVTDAVESE